MFDAWKVPCKDICSMESRVTADFHTKHGKRNSGKFCNMSSWFELHYICKEGNGETERTLQGSSITTFSIRKHLWEKLSREQIFVCYMSVVVLCPNMYVGRGILIFIIPSTIITSFSHTFLILQCLNPINYSNLNVLWVIKKEYLIFFHFSYYIYHCIQNYIMLPF